MSDEEWVLVNVHGALVLDDDIWDTNPEMHEGVPLRALAAYLPSESTLCVAVRPGLRPEAAQDCWQRLLAGVEESADGPTPLWRYDHNLLGIAALADLVPAILDFE